MKKKILFRLDSKYLTNKQDQFSFFYMSNNELNILGDNYCVNHI